MWIEEGIGGIAKKDGFIPLAEGRLNLFMSMKTIEMLMEKQ